MKELSPQELRKICTTEDLNEAVARNHFSDGVWIGVAQDRVRQAIRFGLNSDHVGQHIALIGTNGVPVLGAIKKHIQDLHAANEVKKRKIVDVCGVFNFDNQMNPKWILLHKGYGKQFRQEMLKLAGTIKKVIPETFSHSDVATRLNEPMRSYREFVDSEHARFREIMEENGFCMFVKPHMFWIYKPAEGLEDESSPITLDYTDEKEPLSLDDRAELTEDEEEFVRRYTQEYQEVLQERARLYKKALMEQEKVKRQILSDTTDELFGELKQSEVVQRNFSKGMDKYLETLKQYVLSNYEDLIGANEDGMSWGSMVMGESQDDKGNPFLPFEVNVFVDNSEADEPVIVVEDNPTYENLVGKINSKSRGLMGIVTDHTMVESGSVAQANGGFLLVDLDELITKPNAGLAYSAFKNILKTQKLEIEGAMSFMGMGTGNPLEPQKLPMNVKVILAGSSHMWRVISYYDPEIKEIFGVTAEVNPVLDSNSLELAEFKAWVSHYAESQKLPTFSDKAIAKLVEHTYRLADQKDKIAIAFGDIQRVMHEASYISENSEEVSDADVQKALKNIVYRSDLIREKMLERVEDGTFIFDFKGKKVGEAYGLVVYSLPDVSFGLPGRVSAQVFASPKLTFTSIDKEAELAGSMLRKAHETVRHYLYGKFGRKAPLAFGASFAFEEAYSGVDGPSASLIEMLTLLSSVANVPVRQDIAMTGSMDLHGNAQVIGGANQKVEGFFDALSATVGFEEPHAVAIPHQNAKNLMLREDIIKKVEDGSFTVWSVRHIDDAIEIFTGMKAGEPDEEGNYPEGTFWHKVEKELWKLAETAKGFAGLVPEDPSQN